MKFPKSMHADGWANHIEATDAPKRSNPLGPAGSRRGAGAKISITAPLHDGPPAADTTRLQAPTASPRIDPAPTATGARTAALPPQRQNSSSWVVPAAAGAIVIAGVAMWAVNRSHVEPTTPPALVTGSVEPATQVAAVTPEPAPAADRDDSVAATPTPPVALPEPAPAAEPARLGPPVTTVKPAAEPRPTAVAKADVPAPRPDMVLRANPRDTAPAPTPYLQPVTPVAPVAAAPVDTLPQGSAPINLPPTAAGPVAVATPQAVPQATPAPDTAAPVAAAPGTALPAQAALPAAEDSGITLKVRSALLADATLAAVPIAVSTDHGVVKLEGQAPDAPTRERATVVAASAVGVKAVDNRLTLPPATVVGQAPTSTL